MLPICEPYKKAAAASNIYSYFDTVNSHLFVFIKDLSRGKQKVEKLYL